MSEFRFAIMGAGKIARKFCDAVNLLPNCRVVAVASKSKERAETLAAEKNIPSAYDDYEQMLKEKMPDCVYIATTPHAHYSLGMLCLDYKVPVLCEKAMFLNSNEAESFFSRAKAQNVFARDARWSRFLPANKKARAWIAEGKIGSLVFGDMGIGFIAPNDPKGRYFNPALGGGAAFDITVYGYMLTTWILNKSEIRSNVEVTRSHTGVTETELVLLQLEDNIPAVIKSSFVTQVENQLIIYGTSGKIVIPRPHHTDDAYLFNNKGEIVEHYVDNETENGFTYEIEETIRCIQEGKVESSIVPHEATIACAKLFDRINQG